MNEGVVHQPLSLDEGDLYQLDILIMQLPILYVFIHTCVGVHFYKIKVARRSGLSPLSGDISSE